MNLPEQTKEILCRAREVYGNNNQILVAIEELNELACVCAKYPRYEDQVRALYELRGKVLDEVADVCIVLDHIQAIFNITDEEVLERATRKAQRVDRWLHDSSSMEQTTRDRKV